MKFTPFNDWILVKMDPIPEKRGELFLVHGDRVRTGTVVSTGKGKIDGNRRIRVDLEPGEKIAFFREHLEHKQGKLIVENLEDIGEDMGLLRANDVLFAFEGELTVTV